MIDFNELRGTNYPNGSDQHPRAYICDPAVYDVVGAQVFVMLIHMGLREWHQVLDVGCGCLRVGKLLIPWLLPGCYCGIDPNAWLINQGVEDELGLSITDVKRPRFSDNADFDLSVFGHPFDVILANSIMTHATEWQVEQFLRSAAANVAPDGCILATFNFGLNGATGNAEWSYPGTVDQDFDKVKALAGELGLEILSLQENLWTILAQQWMAFFPDLDRYREVRQQWAKLERMEGV